MHDFKTVDNMENINNHHPCAHFIIFSNGSLVFTVWKRAETSSTTSLLLIRQVATSDFRIFPYSLVVVLVCAQMRSDSGINPYSLKHGVVRIVLVTSPD